MVRHKEYVTPAGLRGDGRRPLELRPVSVKLGALSGCDGSCLVQIGSSTVCASVFGPRDAVIKGDFRVDEVNITCEVGYTAFAGERHSSQHRRGRLTDDIAATITQIAQSTVLKSQYPNSTIHIFVQIIRQDGDERIASINAACLALADANIAMRDIVCCVNVGLLDEAVLVDLMGDELRSQCPVMCVAFAGHHADRIVWLETTSRLAAGTLERLLAAAQQCATVLFHETFKAALNEHARRALTFTT